MKTWKNLIVPVIILAALLGGFIFYSAVIKDRQNADQLESSETMDSGNYLVYYLPDDLAGIYVLK